MGPISPSTEAGDMACISASAETTVSAPADASSISQRRAAGPVNSTGSTESLVSTMTPRGVLRQRRQTPLTNPGVESVPPGTDRLYGEGAGEAPGRGGDSGEERRGQLRPADHQVGQAGVGPVVEERGAVDARRVQTGRPGHGHGCRRVPFV